MSSADYKDLTKIDLKDLFIICEDNVLQESEKLYAKNKDIALANNQKYVRLEDPIHTHNFIHNMFVTNYVVVTSYLANSVGVLLITFCIYHLIKVALKKRKDKKL